MKYIQTINEMLLANQFKIGFELEGVLKHNNDEYDIEDYDIQNVKDLFSHVDEIWKTGTVSKDGSIQVDDSNIDIAFEYQSPVLIFNPQNLKKIFNLLNSLSSLNIYTNSSCGFHIHISADGLNVLDHLYILCNIALDKEFTKKILQYKDIEFFNDKYAYDILKDLSLLLKKTKESNDFTDLIVFVDDYKDTKYGNFRLHPQGTLEWRGPRNFLNSNNINLIKGAFKLLSELIQFMSKVVSQNPIDKFLVSLKNVIYNYSPIDTTKETPYGIVYKLQDVIKEYITSNVQKGVYTYDEFKTKFNTSLDTFYYKNLFQKPLIKFGIKILEYKSKGSFKIVKTDKEFVYIQNIQEDFNYDYLVVSTEELKQEVLKYINIHQKITTGLVYKEYDNGSMWKEYKNSFELINNDDQTSIVLFKKVVDNIFGTYDDVYDYSKEIVDVLSDSNIVHDVKTEALQNFNIFNINPKIFKQLFNNPILLKNIYNNDKFHNIYKPETNIEKQNYKEFLKFAKTL